MIYISRVLLLLILGFIGFYFSYTSFKNHELSKLQLSKINVDQNIGFAKSQIKVLAQSLIIKNSFRFQTKDVLENTASYIMLETNDISSIEFTSYIKDFSTTHQNNAIPSSSKYLTQAETEVIDASQTLGKVKAIIDIEHILRRTDNLGVTLENTSESSILKSCSVGTLEATSYFYCHTVSSKYFLKEVLPNALTYFIALLLCSLLLYQFYVSLTVKLQQQKKEIHAYEQISHDIKSPITALSIISEAKTIDDRTMPLLQHSVSRLKNIINSKSKTDMSLDATNLDELIVGILQEKKLNHKNVNFEYKNLLSTAAFSLVDPIEMKRIVSNILNNSIEALTDKKIIEVTLKQDKHQLCLIITDHGKGIPPNAINRVFDRNFTHDKTHGTGLGLFHAKERITQWNGSIKIESKVNSGTKVLLYLPYMQSKLKA